MAAQVQEEGTSNSGENVEANTFEQFLLSKGVSNDTIQKLIQNGLDTLEHLEDIDLSDYNDIASDCHIKSLQKVKLKTAIKSLQSRAQLKLPPVMIDKEERLALSGMSKKIKAMEESITLIHETTKNIDEEVNNDKNRIRSTFKEIHGLLDERETKLIEQLNKISNEKKEKLEIVSNRLNQQHIESKQKLEECSSKLRKPTEIDEIDDRIEGILQIAKEMDDIKIITKKDLIINNNKINISFNKISINKIINSFGNICDDAVPILISLTDNKNCTISIKWKINENKQLNNNNNNKLKILWNETKSNDIDQFDEKWQYNKQIDLNNNKDDININIENKTAIYAFKMQYFDGNKWSIPSNIKSISIKQQNCTDSWDPNCKYETFKITGNSIVNTDGSYCSAYLSRVVSEGIHSWKFKIDKYTSGWQLIGIWKTKFDPITNTYFEKNTNQSYGFALDSGYLSDPNKKGDNLKQYGAKCNNGDVIEMTLNLINCSLLYKINGTDYGKAFDVEKTSYRAAATLYCQDTKFTLLSYQSR